VFIHVTRIEFAEVLDDVEFGGHFGDIILFSANPVMYEYVCGCLGVCMCARDHNGNTTPSLPLQVLRVNTSIQIQQFLVEYI